MRVVLKAMNNGNKQLPEKITMLSTDIDNFIHVLTYIKEQLAKTGRELVDIKFHTPYLPAHNYIEMTIADEPGNETINLSFSGFQELKDFFQEYEINSTYAILYLIYSKLISTNKYYRTISDVKIDKNSIYFNFILPTIINERVNIYIEKSILYIESYSHIYIEFDINDPLFDINDNYVDFMMSEFIKKFAAEQADKYQKCNELMNDIGNQICTNIINNNKLSDLMNNLYNKYLEVGCLEDDYI